MNRSLVAAARPYESADHNAWDRTNNESAKAFNAFIVYRGLGPERTIQKAAEKLQKSGAVLRRWAVRFNWRGRALNFDEHIDSETQRAMLSRRIRLRQRALNIADRLSEKMAAAVELLQVGRVVKVEGKPDEEVLAIT